MKTVDNFCHYDIGLKIDADNEFMMANVVLQYHASEPTNELVFCLHRNMEITSVECDGLEKYCFNKETCSYRYATESGTLTVCLDRFLSAGEMLTIGIGYSGHIGVVPWQVNRLTSEWIELGLYAPWFPYNPSLGEFTYKVTIEISVPYDVMGSGEVTGQGTKWLLYTEIPRIDIVVIAAPSMRKHRLVQDGYSVDISYIADEDSPVYMDIMRSGVQLLETYAKWFGDTTFNQASIVIAPRHKGGGYARKGFVVLTPTDTSEYTQKRTSYYKWLAHEIAHLWWYKTFSTQTWEDWLNESFAEYTALMAVRGEFGEEAFVDYVNSKREIMAGLPDIYGLDRNDEKAYEVLYHKGCVLLHELDLRIGANQFMKFLKRLHTENVRSTDEFLNILSTMCGKNASKWFAAKLGIK